MAEARPQGSGDLSANAEAYFAVGLSAVIADRLGLNYPPERHADLLRTLRPVLSDFGIGLTEGGLSRLRAEALPLELHDALTAALTIGETYFFRDSGLFQALEQLILPELLSSRLEGGRQLRLWSAGCCTGEEAYSLAMSLRKFRPCVQSCNAFILGTDINPVFLRKAALGRYRKWSFRETPEEVRQVYFRPAGEGLWTLDPLIRQMVTFAALNLARDDFPSLSTSTLDMDLILCRNVLMYFTPDVTRRVVAGLRRALCDGGWLVVAPSEFNLVEDAGFVPVRTTGGTVYRKMDKIAVRPVRAVAPEPDAPRPRTGNGVRPEGRTWDAPARPPVPDPERTVLSPAGGLEGREHEAAGNLYASGRYAEAARNLEEFFGPAGPAVHDPGLYLREMFLLIRSLVNIGELEAALDWCGRAVEADKLSAGARYLRATVLHELGRLDEARAELTKTLYLDGRFVAAHVMAGNLARAAGAGDESARHYRNALDVLNGCQPGETVPETDGMTAGRMIGMVRAIAGMEV